MKISFLPSLGQSSVVPVCLAYANTTELCFTATLDAHDYDELHHDRAILQLWSDFPAKGRSNGEWGELDFEEIAPPNPTTVVSLLSAQEDTQPQTLYLRIFVDFSDGASQNFSYTYRLLYPSGDVKWLGAFGDNGFITLEPVHDDDRITTVGDAWKREDSSQVWDSQGKTAENVVIGELTHLDDWVLWSFGLDSTLIHPKDANMIFLVPAKQGLVIPSTIVLSATQGLTLSVDQGKILASGRGSVLLTCPSSAGSMGIFVDTILHFSSSRCHVLGYSGGSVVLSTQVEQCPISVTTVPLSLWPSSHSVTIGWSKLASSLVPSVDNPLILSSTQSEALRIYDRPSDDIHIFVPATGSRFTLAPLYTIPHDELKLQIAVISTHILKNARRESLPTPPPSPRFRTQIPKAASINLNVPYAVRKTPPRTSRSRSYSHSPPPPPASGGIVAFLKKVVLSVVIFAVTLFRRFISTRQQKTPSISDGQRTPPPVDETTPLLQDAISNEEAMIPASPITETEVSENAQPTSPRTSGLSFGVLDAGDIHCLVRSPSGSTGVEKQVKFQVGSKDATPKNVKDLGHGVVALTLEPSEPVDGRVSVSVFVSL